MKFFEKFLNKGEGEKKTPDSADKPSEQKNIQKKIEEDAARWQNNTDNELTDYMLKLSGDTSPEFSKQVYEKLKEAKAGDKEIPSKSKVEQARNAYLLQAKSGELNQEQITRIIDRTLGEKKEDAKERKEKNHKLLIQANSLLSSNNIEEVDAMFNKVDQSIDKTYEAMGGKEDPQLKNQINSLKQMSDKLAARSGELKSELSIDKVA